MITPYIVLTNRIADFKFIFSSVSLRRAYALGRVGLLPWTVRLAGGAESDAGGAACRE